MSETTFFVEAARDRTGSYPVRLTYAGRADLSAATSFQFLNGIYAAILSSIPTTIYHTREDVRGISSETMTWEAPEGVDGCGMSRMHLIGAGFAEPAVLRGIGEQKKTSYDWSSVCLLTEEDGKIKVIPDRDKSMTWPATVMEEMLGKGYVGTEREVGLFNFGNGIVPELVKLGEFADDPLPERVEYSNRKVGGICIRRFIDDFGPESLRKFRNTNSARTGLAYPIS
ncbi:MAG: hypothetical protein HY362_01140 [Candidatus Aenigmarchaeota archaeon]|nr:hypothetical protein [Candidatus Aenigmarchaeota archaeon]